MGNVILFVHFLEGLGCLEKMIMRFFFRDIDLVEWSLIIHYVDRPQKSRIRAKSLVTAHYHDYSFPPPPQKKEKKRKNTHTKFNTRIVE